MDSPIVGILIAAEQMKQQLNNSLSSTFGYNASSKRCLDTHEIVYAVVAHAVYTGCKCFSL